MTLKFDRSTIRRTTLLDIAKQKLFQDYTDVSLDVYFEKSRNTGDKQLKVPEDDFRLAIQEIFD